ncbi:MAG: polyisoprenoid-binding protein [Caulobacter sp.]|nr:polyisoprenoid-binding protein [Caulobacter sp.]
MRRFAAIVVLAASLSVGAAPASWAIGPSSTEPADLAGGQWVLDKPHSSVTARVLHMGYSHYTLRFTSFDATFSYDPKAPQAAKVSASVDANSLDTGVASYDTEFADKFLNAGKAPKITFVSTAILRGRDNHGTMTGDLTLRGVTRPVTFDVTFYGTGGGLNPLEKRAGFGAHTTIRRSDFGSTYLIDPAIVGNEVEIIIEAEFTRK